MNALSSRSLLRELTKFGRPERAKAAAWYFKTAAGEYGHGDVFIGVSVPEQRRLAKRYASLPLGEVRRLLRSKWHECRLTALLILVRQYEAADAAGRARLARFYLTNRARVNNWDLVDSSAPHILGRELLTKNRAILYRLARSRDLWERRIAILATFAFIRAGEFGDALALAQLLRQDTHDLIHKAVGWMLREVGNRNSAAEEKFLRQHAAAMPRTMLRYAIEKFPEKKRKHYLRMRAKAMA